MRIQRVVRSLRRFLSGYRKPDSTRIWAAQREALTRATVIVRAFYVALFFIVLSSNSSWERWASSSSLALQWPVAWMDVTGYKAGTALVVGVTLLGALLAAAFPARITWRIVAALGILDYAALWNSVGGSVTSHGLHGWLWVAALFVLLPRGDASDVRWSRPRRQRYLLVFWSAQASLLLFYSLSGFFKAAAVVVQLWLGQVHALMPDALARHVAGRLLEGAHVHVFSLGSWIVDHPDWAGPFLPFAIYLELCSLLVAFRPEIQRVWALLLMLMHVGIFLSMTILFSWQALLVGLLVLCSPFAEESPGLFRIARAMPVMGDLMGLGSRALTRLSTAFRGA